MPEIACEAFYTPRQIGFLADQWMLTYKLAVAYQDMDVLEMLQDSIPEFIDGGDLPQAIGDRMAFIALDTSAVLEQFYNGTISEMGQDKFE